MKVRELAVKRGIEIPKEYHPCGEWEMFSRREGFNKAVDGFQPILDMEITELEPLDEKELHAEWFKYNQQISPQLAFFIKAVCQRFGQPKRKLDVEKLYTFLMNKFGEARNKGLTNVYIHGDSAMYVAKAIAEAYEMGAIIKKDIIEMINPKKDSRPYPDSKNCGCTKVIFY